MTSSMTISRTEYETLKRKAQLYDELAEEELTSKERAQLDGARKGPFLSEAEFKRRHPELR